ncbi:MAG TPA: matrixin family metalloprotease [Candidatus Moranbacteria bacterium]|nr:matrixin family metalloprotease [Candidatus Moranbacteria bacterium]
MKKIFQYILIIILFSFWGIVLTNPESFRGALDFLKKPCSKPIKYSLGEIDPKFNLSQEEMLSITEKAEEVWEKPTGKNLFEYDPQADFKINIVFDERQERTNASKKLESQLGKLESDRENVIKEYDQLSKTYQKRLDDYNKSVSQYEERLEKYLAKVNYWNSRGGAPEDEYEDLKKEKKELDKMRNSLEAERKTINSLVGKTNTLADKENKIVENYNSNLSTYKNKYGEASQFDKGVYDGEKINIFQFNEVEDLRLTIVHELGHALGIEHLGDSTSIMYYLMGDQDMENPQLSEEDIKAVKTTCRIK